MASRRPAGLGTISKRKDGRFVGAIFLDTVTGARKRFFVYGKTRAEAEGKLSELIERGNKGVLMPDASWSIGAYLDHWLTHIAPMRFRPKTLQLYAGITRQYLKPYLGSKRLRTLTVTDVQQALDAMHAHGTTARRCQQAKTTLSSALTSAMRNDLIFRNVARLAEPPLYKSPSARPWNLEEAKRFMSAIEGHRWEVGYLLNLVYGARQGEALGLQWRDIDLRDDSLSITKQLQTTGTELTLTPPKTESSVRDLPIVPLLRAKLMELALLQGITLNLTADPATTNYADRPIVQSKNGGFVWPRNYARRFFEFLEEAQIRRITPHQIRHTTATILKSLGVQARDTQLILGHASSSTTTQIYQQYDFNERREALSGLAAALAAPGTDLPSSDRAQLGSSQKVLSSPPRVASAATAEPVKDKKNRRSPEVETADLLGGSGEARTHDILLKRPYWNPYCDVATSENRALQTRSRLTQMGAVVVRKCGQPVGSLVLSDPRVLHLGWQRDELRHAMTEKLRRASFPLNLLPASPSLST